MEDKGGEGTTTIMEREIKKNRRIIEKEEKGGERITRIIERKENKDHGLWKRRRRKNEDNGKGGEEG